MYGRMDMWIDGCMAGWIYVCMDGCLDTYERLYGCIFILVKYDREIVMIYWSIGEIVYVEWDKK